MDVAMTFRRLLSGTFSGALFLLGTHGGEFWPFSTFPMFAHADPWDRTLVRDVTEVEEGLWGQEELVGTPFSLVSAGLDQNDVVKMMREFGDTLEPEEAQILSHLFAEVRQEKRLLLYLVHGELATGFEGVEMRYKPVVIIDQAGARPVGGLVQ